MTEPLNSPIDVLPSDLPWLSWLARAALVVLTLSIVAAQAPARVKLLGLFWIGVGGAMGVAIALITRPHPNRIPWRWRGAVCAMTFCGMIGSTWLAFRSESVLQAKSPQQQMAATMMKQMERDSDGAVIPVPAVSTVSEFNRYLTRRVRQLGAWSRPWPVWFWIGELIAGAVAAEWGFRFGVAQLRKPGASEEPAP